MSVDSWQLVLEYVKALAPPGAAVSIAWLALRTYKAQRRLDRRSEWYQEFHRVLGGGASLFGWAAVAEKSGDRDRAERRAVELFAQIQTIVELASQGFLFGLREDLVVLRDLGVELERIRTEISAAKKVTLELSVEGADACLVARDGLARGYRKEMGLPAVNLTEITVRRWGA